MNTVDYLRISLIDRCNFRCQYCMPEGAEIDYILKQDLLTDNELLSLLKEVFIPVGFTRFRLTGGEPLLRPNVIGLIEAIASFPETKDLSMTTNGFLLSKMAKDLYKAGLRRINISLDTLDSDTFNLIIGNKNRSHWQLVWNGIQAAYEVGFDPLKINVVIIPRVNDHEVLDLAALTIDRNWHIRFIEFMPFDGNSWDRSKTVSEKDILDELNSHYNNQISTLSKHKNSTSNNYKIATYQGDFGIISTVTNPFCDGCNRLRLTADGKIKNCLFSNSETDLLTALRNNEDYISLIERAVNSKNKMLGGFKDFEGDQIIENRSMTTIGG